MNMPKISLGKSGVGGGISTLSRHTEMKLVAFEVFNRKNLPSILHGKWYTHRIVAQEIPMGAKCTSGA